MTPGSMRWTSAPSETKSSAPRGRMFRPYLILLSLVNSHAAEGREAAVHRHDDACHEAGGRRQEPQHGAEQILRLAEAAHGRVGDDALAARRESAGLFVGQK